MEGLNPTLRLIWEVKKSIERGESVRQGIKNYILVEDSKPKALVSLWFVRIEQGEAVIDILEKIRSPYRRHLLLVLQRGLKGESIIEALRQLEIETSERVLSDLEEFSSRLPYLLLAPLCLFLFPACLILMLGPFLMELMQAF